MADGVRIRTHKHRQSIEIQFQYRGVRCRESLKLEPTKSNLRYATGLRAQIITEIEKGIFQYGKHFPDSKRAGLFGETSSTGTIGEKLRDYKATIQKAVAAGNISPSTQDGYDKAVRKLLATFDKTPLLELSHQSLKAFVESLDTTAKSVRNTLIPMRAIVEDALNDGDIQQNPFSRLAMKKLMRTKPKSEYEVDHFTREEVVSILEHAGACRPLWQFAFWSGLRTSELIALDMQDIQDTVIKVRRAVVVHVERNTTKTEAGKRDVVILPGARQALAALTHKTGRVFRHPKTGEGWIDDQQLRKAWIQILKRAGVRYRNPYQTRHTYASMLLSTGENPLWVAEQMGHADTEMITRTYGKWLPPRDGYTPITMQAR